MGDGMGGGSGCFGGAPVLHPFVEMLYFPIKTRTPMGNGTFRDTPCAQR